MKKSKMITLCVLSVVCIGITAVTLHGIFNREDDSKIVRMSAYSYEDVSPEYMEEEADIIFVGEYTGETSQVMTDKSVKPDAVSPVYTDHVFKVTDVAKGECAETVNLRLAYGETDGGIYATSGLPDLEQGEKYLLYLRKGTDAVKNDVDNYFLIGGTQSCFKIEDGENLDLTGENTQDAQKIQAMYDTAVGDAVTE